MHPLIFLKKVLHYLGLNTKFIGLIFITFQNSEGRYKKTKSPPVSYNDLKKCSKLRLIRHLFAACANGSDLGYF